MIDHVNKIIFIHLEKTGGTSLEKMYTNRDWWWNGLYPSLKNKNKYKYDNGRIKHLSYDMSKIFFKNFFDEYKKITIVRHPYTLFISKYFHFNRNSKVNKIDKFQIKKLIKDSNNRWNIKKLHEFLGDKNNYDFIIKFENYAIDYDKMCNKLNIKKFKLQHLFKSKYDKKKDYLTPEAKNCIKEYAKDYAKIFDYNL